MISMYNELHAKRSLLKRDNDLHEHKKKFGSKKFHELLQNIQNLPLIEQKETLLKSLSEHQQNEEQRDDITVIGLKLWWNFHFRIVLA